MDCTDMSILTHRGIFLCTQVWEGEWVLKECRRIYIHFQCYEGLEDCMIHKIMCFNSLIIDSKFETPIGYSFLNKWKHGTTLLVFSFLLLNWIHLVRKPRLFLCKRHMNKSVYLYRLLLQHVKALLLQYSRANNVKA